MEKLLYMNFKFMSAYEFLDRLGVLTTIELMEVVAPSRIAMTECPIIAMIRSESSYLEMYVSYFNEDEEDDDNGDCWDEENEEDGEDGEDDICPICGATLVFTGLTDEFEPIYECPFEDEQH